MMDGNLLFSIFIFLASACIAVPLSSRLKLGSVLGYLIAGVCIGPYGLRFINNSQEIIHLAEFGVVMMLFVIGLELEPEKLWRLRKSIVGFGGLQVVLTSGAFTALGLSAGFDLASSLAVGLALSLSSTALVLQMLQERNLTQTSVGERALSILLFQDIAVIPILIVLPLFAASGALPAHDGATVWLSDIPGLLHALIVAGSIALVIAFGRLLSRHLFGFIARTNLREMFTALSLALVVGVALLMLSLGISPAFGAFIAGVVLANSEYKHMLETDIEPFKGLLLGLFFISVGMGMNIDLLVGQPLNILSAVALLLVVKACILLVLGRLFGLDLRQNMGLSLALAQGGEFAFVLFQYANGLNIIDSAQASFLSVTVALSMAATPLLIALYARFVVPRFMSMLPARDYDRVENQNNAVIIAGYGRFGQVIGRFLSAQGVKATILDKDSDQIDLLRRFGSRGFYGDATRLDLLRNAGAEQARLLVIAVDDRDAALEIVRLTKTHFPDLKVLTRARNRRHAYDLHKTGADYYHRELLDSSLMMAQEVMRQLGYNADEMKRRAEQFRAHDVQTLRKSFEFFEQEDELITFSRAATGELENILQSDLRGEESRSHV